MASEESKRIRATFVNDSEAINVPIEVQRRDWEEGALQTPLPPDTHIEPLSADGVPCEKVSCGIVDQSKVMLWLHGGGFNAGSAKTHRELAARLSLATGIPILLPDYRLAPEYPFPAGLEDSVKVYRWLIRHGTHPGHIVVGGDSAGGGLAISTLLSLLDAGEPMPAAAVLISPMLDLTLSGESIQSRAALDPLVSREGLSAAIKLYIGNRDPREPLLSPIYADLHGLPPMLIHVGDHERLLSDSVTLAERASAVGVEVNLDIWAEMWHVWHAFAATLPEGQQALEQIGEYVRQKTSHGTKSSD